MFLSFNAFRVYIPVSSSCHLCYYTTVTMHLSIYPVILTPSQLRSQATSSWLPISVINSLPTRPCGWA